MLIILFLVLPWNLGKHFEGIYSSVNSNQIPYLIPTVYLQDLLVLGIVTLLLISAFSSYISRFAVPAFSRRLLFLLLLTAGLSFAFTSRMIPALYSFSRLFLYSLFFIVSVPLFYKPSVRRWFFRILALNVVFLSALALLQFYRQSAVFNNYLFFGEQPYNVYTPYIAKESFGGIVKIPPYGTFQHPNTLAGFLVISLTLLIFYLSAKGRLGLDTLPVLGLGAGAVFLTKSYTAWAALAFGVVLLGITIFVKSSRRVSAVFLLSVFSVITAGLALPVYRTGALHMLPSDSVTSVLSVDRRSALLQASYLMFLQKPFFGWGMNSFTYSFTPFYSQPDIIKFIQPVHNVFVLIAVELGGFGLLFTLVLLVCFTSRLSSASCKVYAVILLQVVFLASFDHYVITTPQMQLFLILTLLTGLAYTKDANCL